MNDNDDESLNSSEEQADRASGDDRYDYNLPRRFCEYKCAAEFSAEERGFYVDDHLQEILSLLNVLFLKENEYSEQQIVHSGLANLEALRSTIVDGYMDSSVKFDTNLYNQISAVLSNFRFQDGTRVMNAQFHSRRMYHWRQAGRGKT